MAHRQSRANEAVQYTELAGLVVRTKQQVVAEFRCSEILQAARKVFSKRGFRDASVGRYRRRRGRRQGHHLQLFPFKEGIYLGALSQGVQELAELTERKMDFAKNIRDKIEAFIRTRLEFAQANREFFAVYHSEFGNLIHPAALNQNFRSLYRQQLERLVNMLREAAERGELSDVSPETLAVMIYESTRGLMLRRSLGWSTRTIDEQVSTLMRILWDGAGVRAHVDC